MFYKVSKNFTLSGILVSGIVFMFVLLRQGHILSSLPLKLRMELRMALNSFASASTSQAQELKFCFAKCHIKFTLRYAVYLMKQNLADFDEENQSVYAFSSIRFLAQCAIRFTSQDHCMWHILILYLPCPY